MWSVTELNQELEVEKGEAGQATELSYTQVEELYNEKMACSYYWHLFSVSYGSDFGVHARSLFHLAGVQPYAELEDA